MIFSKELLSTMFVSAVMIILNYYYLQNMNFALFTPKLTQISLLKALQTNQTFYQMHMNWTSNDDFKNFTLPLDRKPYYFTNKTDLAELENLYNTTLDKLLEKNIKNYMQ